MAVPVFRGQNRYWVGVDFDFEDGNLDNMIERLQKLRVQHPGKRMRIDSEYSEGGSVPKIQVMETEPLHEWRRNMKNDASRLFNQDEADRVLYARLKQKFEGGGQA